jgi:pimeloyl-ACP methyl ester carboxylesterase
MALNLSGATVVLLPGTGSDDDYARRVFTPALRGVGATVLTPPPDPKRLVAGYRDALDDAARSGPIAVGGISIGAAVALRWALDHSSRTLGVLAALPAWTGSPVDAPAAHAARHTAHLLRGGGLASTIAQMRASSPQWLGQELARSWSGQWPALPDAMEEAASFVAPTTGEMSTLAVPMGVASATDDAVHPAEVALEWARAAPRAALRTLTLDAMGVDPAVLGAACLTALMQA